MFHSTTIFDYTHTDHLGSLTEITDNTGTLIQRIVYNAWGQRELLVDNTATEKFLFDRGFTGHEHLDEFGLINMNGRMYDPILGSMLSPDNYVQNPYGTQGFNRYTYAGNNPLVYVDPDGNNPLLIAAIIIGAAAGGYTGYKIADAKGYDMGDWQTWGYMAGGAVIGGFSGYMGATIAAGGGFMANTIATAYSSLTYTSYMSALSNGMIQPSVNFGGASYNIGTKEWRTIGTEGNKWYEDLGYGLGIFSNLTDIWAGIKGSYNSEATLKLETSGHSQTVNPQTGEKFSWGARQPSGEPYPRTLKNAFSKLYAVTDYENKSGILDRYVNINRVNIDKYQKYIDALPKEGQFYRMVLLFPRKGMHCTIATSRALLAGGVFNIPFLRMPWILDLQMRIRDYTFMSYYLNSLPE